MKSLNPSFITGKDFRLMFLRCELFNPKTVAQRIVKYFTVKKKLFGSPDKIKKYVFRRQRGKQRQQYQKQKQEECSCFGPTDCNVWFEWWESGFLQISLKPDAAGWAILVFSPNPVTTEELDPVVRISQDYIRTSCFRVIAICHFFQLLTSVQLTDWYVFLRVVSKKKTESYQFLHDDGSIARWRSPKGRNSFFGIPCWKSWYIGRDPNDAASLLDAICDTRPCRGCTLLLQRPVHATVCCRD